MSSAAPIIRSKQTEKEINGISTQVVCTEFSNYIFVVITQYGKIGTLVSVTPDSRSNDISTPTFSTRVLLGKDECKDGSPIEKMIITMFASGVEKWRHLFFLVFPTVPLTHVCAKHLATFVSQEASNRPVLLGLALKDSSIESIKDMKEIIKSCHVW